MCIGMAGSDRHDISIYEPVHIDVLFDFDGDLGLSGGFGAGVSGLMGTYGLKGIVANVPSSEWAA